MRQEGRQHPPQPEVQLVQLVLLERQLVLLERQLEPQGAQPALLEEYHPQ